MADPEYLTVQYLQTEYIRRIFSKVVVDDTKGCWLWTGSLNGGGYSSMKFHDKKVAVHRLLYAWLVEPLPKGVGKGIPQLDHFTCSTKRCINPTHVKLVTARENILRGTSKSAIHAAKTHCPYGHLLLPQPHLIPGRMQRRCKECLKSPRRRALNTQAQRRYRQRKRLDKAS